LSRLIASHYKFRKEKHKNKGQGRNVQTATPTTKDDKVFELRR
jgi:hypothetical protein